MSDQSFPPADASRSEITAWLNARAIEAVQHEGAVLVQGHEAPPMKNGPSPVCSACGVVRIDVRRGAFCRTCLHVMQEAGVEP